MIKPTFRLSCIILHWFQILKTKLSRSPTEILHCPLKLSHLILQNTSGIRTSCLIVSLKWQALYPCDVEICKCWFDALAVAFWKTKLLFSETMRNKGSWLCWITKVKTSKHAFECVLAMYLWAVLYKSFHFHHLEVTGQSYPLSYCQRIKMISDTMDTSQGFAHKLVMD